MGARIDGRPYRIRGKAVTDRCAGDATNEGKSRAILRGDTHTDRVRCVTLVSPGRHRERFRTALRRGRAAREFARHRLRGDRVHHACRPGFDCAGPSRSEERRVGKEWDAGWSW